MNKKTQIILGVSIAILCLVGGVIYSRSDSTKNDGLLSRSVDQPATPVSTPVNTEKLTQRKKQIQKEILEVTNDPDRSLESRTELHNINLQLESAK